MTGPKTSPKIFPKASRRQLNQRLLLLAIALLATVSVFAMQLNNLPNRNAESNLTAEIDNALTLLTDPFLQLPTDTSVQVVWFTEFEGNQHTLNYGEGLTAEANTTQLSRMREDSDSRVQDQAFPEVTQRNIWRHEATAVGLKPGFHLPYTVTSRDRTGQAVTSSEFTLAPNPPRDRPLKILLTSDHQLKPMTPANLQKVAETVGRVDAVFFAGDLVNVPDRASEWFDDARGLAFFPGLQGRANHAYEKEGATTTYSGGELIQHAPLFPIIGNHEVMGRYATNDKLNSQFTNTLPKNIVTDFYSPPNAKPGTSLPGTFLKEWTEDRSFNTKTYEEIFSLPTADLPGGGSTEQYYATSFGSVRLVSLYVTQVWRSPNLSPETKGRYREKTADLSNPDTWGYGQHIFEDIRKGSAQYSWLQQELASDAFKNAEYKVVMLHHPPHTLGGNIVPAFTDPVAIETRAEDGTLKSVQYEYPKENDYLIRDVMPLLEKANVQLVFYGHSHLWNRFVTPGGINLLETSNVGNSYGAHLAGNPRQVPAAAAAIAAGLLPFKEDYSAIGDPNGLTPITPTLAPLTDDSGNTLPYIASNDITSFTILDTGSSTLSSYYFDTRKPDSDVIKFDELRL